MTKIDGSGPYPSFSSGKTEAEYTYLVTLMDSFTNGFPTEFVPTAPTEGIDSDQPRASHNEIVFNSPNPENGEKRARWLASIQKLGSFAKKHPFLTVAFVIALCLVVGTAFLTIQALLGHTTISIFRAHPEIGGALTFMTLYYSVYLINLCRRASLKDELEAKIQSHNQLTNDLSQNRETNITKLKEEFQNKISISNTERFEKEEELHSLYDLDKEVCKQAQASLERIKTYKEGLTRLINAPKMTLERKNHLQRLIKAAEQAIESATQNLAKKFPTRRLPLPPAFDLEETHITLPQTESNTMAENQSKQKTLLNKLNTTFESLITYVQKNPGSVAMFAVGMGMFVLSGAAIYYYLQGASTVYFFGTLSLTTLVPMTLYGISLIYEGYNNTTINELTENLKKIDKGSALRQKALQDEQRRLEKIKKRP